MKNFVKELNVLMGYDNRGIVYDEQDYVLRKIFPEYFTNVLDIYNRYEKFNLNQLGVVDTELALDYGKNFLRHQKYPISYPYEWTANMFKDAVLFFLELVLELDKFDLTLKDALPSNIVFDFTKPVFVDFLSIIKKKELKNEHWLFSGIKTSLDPRFFVFEKMFFPFMFIPLIKFLKKDYLSGRGMLLNGSCNIKNCKQPSWDDLISRKSFFDFLHCWYLRILINVRKKTDFIFFCKWMLELIKSFEVTPLQGNYDSYYKLKNEDFSFKNENIWKIKQKSVYRILQKNKPKTVLDLGSNTGWFSVLASKQGAKVISTDIDESCVDNLYRYSCKNNLKILPLLLSFNDLEKESFGIVDNESFSNERDYNKNPLFSSATKRLNSDMVLCLALVHHLILGEGKSIKDLFSVLAKLSKKVLVLEYISLDDHLIKNDPSFFKNLYKFSTENYNLDLFITEGKKHFNDFELLDSHPKTRKLLIFNRY